MSCPTLLTKVYTALASWARPMAAVLMLLVVSRPVNVLKGKVSNTCSQTTPSWDDDSLFDQAKEKDGFRQYDDACDHVKEFYREQHGTRPQFPPHLTGYSLLLAFGWMMNREADSRVQSPGSRGVQANGQGPHGYLGSHGEA